MMIKIAKFVEFYFFFDYIEYYRNFAKICHQSTSAQPTARLLLRLAEQYIFFRGDFLWHFLSS